MRDYGSACAHVWWEGGGGGARTRVRSKECKDHAQLIYVRSQKARKFTLEIDENSCH